MIDRPHPATERVSERARSCTAFAGTEQIASGEPSHVAGICQAFLQSGERRGLLIFDDATAHPVELDRRDAARMPTLVSRAWDTPAADETDEPGAAPKRTPGRPKLGVVGREVTLLPRHWEWLGAQPGGASVALRKLVEQARRDDGGEQRARAAREAAYRFMSAMAGDLPGYEEACRSLFAGDGPAFRTHIAAWPRDVCSFADRLAATAFEPRPSP